MEFQVFGDSFQAAFRLASDGLCAALAAQWALQDASWGATGALKVRMALHTGTAVIDPGGEALYLISHMLNRAAQVMSAGYGEQILLSQEAADLVDRELPPGVSLRSLGEHHLKGMTRPEHLYQAVASDLRQDFPALTTGITRPNNLPTALTSFIGRHQEILEVSQRLRHHRLVTLVGAGGTGKTRLSLRVAEELLEGFPESIWFVEFAPVTDPEQVSQTVASTLGLQKTTESSYLAILESYLQSRRILLLLDNCEHLVEACARLANPLLQHCPQVTLLATSREALGIAGETTYYVPSLAAPYPAKGVLPEEMAHAEAIRLLVDRAVAVLPDFHLTPDSLIAAARLCHRLDGIPLAIELAAARLNVLSVEEIASRLDDRFRLLTGGSRIDMPRQRTLRASIDWSYNMLPPAQRLLLQRLSVFSGGRTLRAAEAVCAGDGLEEWEILDALTGLVEKSLLIADQHTPPETRYRMLETIRQYAQERLDESGQAAAVRDRHLQYFLWLAESYEPLLRTPQIYELLERLELDNLRTALSWAVSQGTQAGGEQALRILAALFYFWFIRALIFEADSWLQRAIRLVPEDEPQASSLKAWSYLVLALQKVQFSHFVRETIEHLNLSIALFRQTRDIPGNRLKLALALATRMAAVNQFIHFYPPEPGIQKEAALADGVESSALMQEYLPVEDRETRWLLSWIYLLQARVEFTGTGQDLIFPLTKTAHDLAVQLGDRVLELLILGTLVWLYLPDDPDQCSLHARQGAILSRRLGDKGSGPTVSFYGTLGLCAYLRQQFCDMEDHFQTIEEIYRKTTVTNTVWGEIWNVRMRGVAAVNQPDIPKAQSYLLRALDLALSQDDLYCVFSVLLHLAGVALLCGRNLEAGWLLGFVEAQFESFFKGMDALPDKLELQKHSSQLSCCMSAAELTKCWAEGKALSLEQVLTLGRGICNER